MRAAAALLLVLLAACGFQLRGTASLPFETIFVPNATSGIALHLKRNIQSGSTTRPVDDAKGAQALLQFSEETRTKEIVALNTAGRVREYRLIYRVGFRVSDPQGGEFVQPSTVTLFREITYSDEEALAKETEEQLLFGELQSEMVQQIMRRLSAARAPAPRQ